MTLGSAMLNVTAPPGLPKTGVRDPEPPDGATSFWWTLPPGPNLAVRSDELLLLPPLVGLSGCCEPVCEGVRAGEEDEEEVEAILGNRNDR